MFKLPIITLTVTVACTNITYAQTACGRAMMMAGQSITQTKNSTTINENEVRLKRMLEKECEIDLNKERDTQNFAQRRIEARTAWNTVKLDMKACLNDKLEVDGLTVDELLNRAVAPSDKMLKDYRTDCFAQLRK
jgi:hypothetical protein